MKRTVICISLLSQVKLTYSFKKQEWVIIIIIIVASIL